MDPLIYMPAFDGSESYRLLLRERKTSHVNMSHSGHKNFDSAIETHKGPDRQPDHWAFFLCICIGKWKNFHPGVG